MDEVSGRSTQGKVERFQQTAKKWLRAQPGQPATIAQLQALLDAFTATYDTERPHRSLPQQATPATACAARPKAVPGDRSAGTTTGSAATKSANPATSRSAPAAACTTSASAAPTPAPCPARK